jgi:hypothetical protein
VLSIKEPPGLEFVMLTPHSRTAASTAPTFAGFIIAMDGDGRTVALPAFEIARSITQFG